MRLICYTTTGEAPNIVPARVERAWMDQTFCAQAYRCLPLNIANQHGWMILNTVPFVAEWDGGISSGAITIRTAGPNETAAAESHFGSGVLSFLVPGVFRSEPGFDLMVTGPLNMPKDAIQPLSGIVETDWPPFTFTMNWKFTRPGTRISFDRDEPFCMIYPMPRGLVDKVEPEIRPIETDAELKAAFTNWAMKRRGFNQALREANPRTKAGTWQRDYFTGDTEYARSPPDHRTRLRPKPFTVVTRWRPGSLMDQLGHQQTEDNRVGRERLRDGILRPTPRTVRIGAAAAIDVDALDFICQPDFLTAAEVRSLADAARSLTRASTQGGSREPRIASFSDAARECPDDAALMLNIRGRIMRRLVDFYELTLPLYTDSLHLLLLPGGAWLDPRAIRAHADGSPHAMAHREFASVIILNDDYEGGEMYFPRLDFVVTPRAGMLLAFTAGWHHEQGVSRVSKGDQLMLTACHTFDATMRDAGLPAVDDPPA